MHITLIITGGIAAYKTLECIRLLKQAQHQVTPIMTRAAEKFVTPLALEAITGAPVYRDLFAPGLESGIGHIQLARQTDAILVAPASADFIARVALGLADDLASTVMLATKAPIFMAPAMNPVMWQAGTTQAHLHTLTQRGVRFIGPEAGDMACGESGPGRMTEPADMVAYVQHALNTTGEALSLAGRQVVITGGATHEPIDPVRFVGNHSSGRQAVALARAAMQRGAAVTLIHGSISVTPPPGCHTIAVQTAAQMYTAACGYNTADVFIAAAAVADWQPDYHAQKIKKNLEKQNNNELFLRFTPTQDIVHSIASATPRPTVVVGFAAETAPDTTQALAWAREKCWRKGCEMLLCNPIAADNPTFGAQDSQIYYFAKPSHAQNAEDLLMENWGHQDKAQHAVLLMDKIVSYLVHTKAS